MIMKFLFRKKLGASIESQIELAEDFLAKFKQILLQKNLRVRVNYALAVSHLVRETASKFAISHRSALYGDTLTWQQLGDAIDDWAVALEAATRLSENEVSEAARDHGVYLGHAILLARVIYQMKFSQQQFPEIMGERVSHTYHISTQLSELFLGLATGIKTDDQLMFFVEKMRS